MTSKVQANCSNYEMDSLRLGLFAVELTANTGVIFLCTVFVILLRRTNTLDRNPKVSLANHQFAAFNTAWTRYLLIPQMIVPGGLLDEANIIFKCFNWIHDVSINVNTFIQLAITLECVLSTFFPLQYERFTAPLWIAVCTFLWPWAITGTIYGIEQLKFVETLPVFAGFEVLNICCWFVVVFLYVINRRKYKQISAGNLTGKYKIIVNIKTVRTLNFVSALSTIRNLFTVTLLLLIILHFKPMCNYYGYVMSSHSYDLIVTFYNLLLIVPLVLTHDEFAKHFRTFLGIQQSKGTNPKGTSGYGGVQNQLTPGMAKNALGERLVVSNNPTDYFAQLQSQWDTVPNAGTDHPSPGTRSIPPQWATAANNRRGSRRIVEVEIPVMVK